MRVRRCITRRRFHVILYYASLVHSDAFMLTQAKADGYDLSERMGRDQGSQVRNCSVIHTPGNSLLIWTVHCVFRFDASLTARDEPRAPSVTPHGSATGGHRSPFTSPLSFQGQFGRRLPLPPTSSESTGFCITVLLSCLRTSGHPQPLSFLIRSRATSQHGGRIIFCEDTRHHAGRGWRDLRTASS